MNQFLTFVVNHWILWSAFILIIIALLAYELQLKVGGIQKTSSQDLVRMMNKEDALVIDIRTVDIFKAGHILGSKNIPVSEVQAKLATLEKYKDKPVIIVDAVGQAYLKTGMLLRKEGFKQVSYLAGGISAWKSANLPIKQGKE